MDMLACIFIFKGKIIGITECRFAVGTQNVIHSFIPFFLTSCISICCNPAIIKKKKKEFGNKKEEKKDLLFLLQKSLMNPTDWHRYINFKHFFFFSNSFITRSVFWYIFFILFPNRLLSIYFAKELLNDKRIMNVAE